jgi:hypothetical protein
MQTKIGLDCTKAPAAAEWATWIPGVPAGEENSGTAILIVNVYALIDRRQRPSFFGPMENSSKLSFARSKNGI